MAKTVKVSKTGTTSADVVSNELKALLEASLNLSAELVAFEKAVSMLNSGALSVRGLKATIEAANAKGQLPTIKTSTAQYFVNASRVRALAGGADKPLKDILNATIQAKRAKKIGENGKEVSMFEELLENAESFAQFVKATPKQGEKSGSGTRSKATLDDVIANALEDIAKIENLFITNVAMAEALINGLRPYIRAAKSPNHPSVRAA